MIRDNNNNSMSSPTSSLKLLFCNTYDTSMEPIDFTTVDDYEVCELDFIDPMTNWQAESFESAAADYSSCCFSSQSCNDFASSDLLRHDQMAVDNAQEDSIITVSTEGVNPNCQGLPFNQKRNSAFVEWKAANPNPPHSLQPSKYPSLQKRWIRFLHDINNHKIGPLLYKSNSGDRSITVRHTYDKLAIHHVVSERKRRGQMSDIFSALRAIVPMKPKKAGRATVLLQTKDYVIQLHERIQQLEHRNRELEALLLERSSVHYISRLPLTHNVHL